MKNIETKILTEEYYQSFEALYNDFKNTAMQNYNFELEPLDYEDFMDSINKKLINCIILLENNNPTAFLVYTTMISEAIELNIIHTMNNCDYVIKSKYLLEEFLKQTEDLRKYKIVCYPMLGEQRSLIGEISRFGFKFIGIAVLRFLMNGTNSRDILKMTTMRELPKCYNIIPWDEKYFDDAVNIIQEAFKSSCDALFDPRFKTNQGTFDILSKITQNIYAEFLPEATSILMCNNYPVGFCFMNLTDNRIVNIPIFGLKPEHQGKGLSKFLLKYSMDAVINMVETHRKPITEINTCTETNNFQALKTYRYLGFKEDYSYPQSYLETSKIKI